MNAQDPTKRFSDRAEAYSAHRPGYPSAVFDVLFRGLPDARTLTAADIGAGTGISSHLLAKHVRSVVAVEPNARMRERAASAANVQWREGVAESTGLDSKSVDLAVAFQAFHWFDAPRAFEEFERIARRRIGIVQYERDESRTFSRAYGDMIRPFMLDDTEERRMRAMTEFERLAGDALQRDVIFATQQLTLEGLLGRLSSSSYVPQQGERAEYLRSLARDLFAKWSESGTVELAMSMFVLTVDVA